MIKVLYDIKALLSLPENFTTNMLLNLCFLAIENVYYVITEYVIIRVSGYNHFEFYHHVMLWIRTCM